MAVKLRLKRMGRRNRPFYRLLAIDGRTRRDGRPIEELGHFNPLLDRAAEQAVLKKDRIAYWLGVGAQPSPTVVTLLKKHGIAAARTK